MPGSHCRDERDRQRDRRRLPSQDDCGGHEAETDRKQQRPEVVSSDP